MMISSSLAFGLIIPLTGEGNERHEMRLISDWPAASCQLDIAQLCVEPLKSDLT